MRLKTISLLFALVLATGCGGSGETDAASVSDEHSPTENVEQPAPTFALGEPVALEDGFVATVTSWKTQPTAGAIVADTELYLSRAAEGMTYVVVEYTLTNTGDVEEYFLFAPELSDASGGTSFCNVDATTNYSVHELVRTEPEEENPNYNSGSTYSPGEYKTKADVYEVDQAAWEAGGWTLIMEDAGTVILN